MIKRLVILDYFFRDNTGHDAMHNILLARVALRQGIKTEVWCLDSNPDPAPVFVKKLLSSSTGGKKEWCSYAREAFVRAVELRKRLTMVGDVEACVFVTTIDDHFLASLAVALRWKKVSSRMVVVIRRGLEDVYERSGKTVFAFVRKWASWSIMRFLNSRKNVVFCSDSELITEELKSYGFADSETIPIMLQSGNGCVAVKKKRVTIGYVGGARFDKGFDLLPGIIEVVLKGHSGVGFVVQSYLQGDGQSVVRDAVRKLKQLQKKYWGSIEIIDAPLSEVEYARVLQKCSMVLNAYRRKFYGKGVSGIAAEAIALGKWVVAPEWSWVARQKNKYDKIVTFEGLEVAGVVRAIEECFNKEKEVSKARLLEQSGDWRLFHAPEQLLEILKRCGGPRYETSH